MSFPAASHKAFTSLARLTASPVTVVMPSKLQLGFFSRYDSATASSISLPISVSSSTFSGSVGVVEPNAKGVAAAAVKNPRLVNMIP